VLLFVIHISTPSPLLKFVRALVLSRHSFATWAYIDFAGVLHLDTLSARRLSSARVHRALPHLDSMLPISHHLLESSLTVNIPAKILRRTWFEEFFTPSMSPSTINNCVLLLNLPPKALAGIDLLSFTTSPRFHGVKNVPPGLHFVFAASDTTLSVRHGAWFYVSPGTGSPQVFVKKWDEKTEDLVAEKSQTEVLRWRANLGSIWKDGLTPYRQTVQEGDSGAEDGWSEESSGWQNLTSRVTPTLLSRICGLNPDHWNLTSASSATQDLDQIPGLELSNSTIHPEKELRFLPIDLKKTWRDGAMGRERTEAAQDRSWFLGDLVNNHCQAADTRGREFEILGELQFAFLMVLTLNNNSCLEQWKRLLHLLFTCKQAAKDRSGFYLELLHILRNQLAHCGDIEGGLFDMSEADGGFLKPLFSRFRRSLDEFDGKWKSDLVDELEDLQEFVQKEFGWQLDDSYLKRGMLELEDGERVELEVNGADADDERGDYAPVVVELTPAQLQVLAESDTGQTKDKVESAESSEEEADLDDMDMRY
jgi:A1 cistron-splicing factor AAR2